MENLTAVKLGVYYVAAMVASIVVANNPQFLLPSLFFLAAALVFYVPERWTKKLKSTFTALPQGASYGVKRSKRKNATTSTRVVRCSRVDYDQYETPAYLRRGYSREAL